MPNTLYNQDRIKDVTFIIKTFERFYCVKRLVKSIFRFYPDARIMIADDSKTTCKQYFESKYTDEKVKVFEVEKDCGASYGRNYLVKRVDTKYFVLLDDDFVFDKQTDIARMIDLLEEKNLDILAGYFRNFTTVENSVTKLKVLCQSILNYCQPNNYIGSFNYDASSRILYANYIRNEFPDYTETDVTHNFFVAVTGKIREGNLWDDELKLSPEHTAFFFKAKNNGLKVAFSNCSSVRHMPVRLKKYRVSRNRYYYKLFMAKYNVDKIISTYENGDKVVINYDDVKE